MTIIHETEIVATRFADGVHTYTAAKGARKWTVEVSDADLAKHGNTATGRMKRREHVARALEAAMRGKADGE